LSEHLGIANKGLFFMYFTLASLAIRFFAGQVSDRYGRVAVLKVATALLALSMVLIGFASSSSTLLLAACVLGIAQGMNSPTITAWTVDLSHKAHRGRALATMYIGMELGIGSGALLSGAVYGNNVMMLPYTFWLIAVFPLAAFLYLMFGMHKKVAAVAN
jgi:MFS family permease